MRRHLSLSAPCSLLCCLTQLAPWAVLLPQILRDTRSLDMIGRNQTDPHFFTSASAEVPRPSGRGAARRCAALA
jgi:hypothetical protein